MAGDIGKGSVKDGGPEERGRTMLDVLKLSLLLPPPLVLLLPPLFEVGGVLADVCEKNRQDTRIKLVWLRKFMKKIGMAGGRKLGLKVKETQNLPSIRCSSHSTASVFSCRHGGPARDCHPACDSKRPEEENGSAMHCDQRRSPVRLAV